eukprot:scaffold870_cov268-Pinguiococcus_pyrenoidosus.AAC.3
METRVAAAVHEMHLRAMLQEQLQDILIATAGSDVQRRLLVGIFMIHDHRVGSGLGGDVQQPLDAAGVASGDGRLQRRLPEVRVRVVLGAPVETQGDGVAKALSAGIYERGVAAHGVHQIHVVAGGEDGLEPGVVVLLDGVKNLIHHFFLRLPRHKNQTEAQLRLRQFGLHADLQAALRLAYLLLQRAKGVGSVASAKLPHVFHADDSAVLEALRSGRPRQAQLAGVAPA